MIAPVRPTMSPKGIAVASLGLFILDTFEWRKSDSSSSSNKLESTTLLKRDEHVIGGGGTYAMIGSRVWLPPTRVGILVDKGNDWEEMNVESKLNEFGKEMWIYRDKEGETTKALNLYTGEHRDFKYLTPRVRLEPQDLPSQFHSAKYLHFVCSPTRAIVIQSQLTSTWRPSLVYEPIPDRCIPEELDSLRKILPNVEIFSPNHEEAASFFGISPSQVKERGKTGVEQIARRFLDDGAKDLVIIRSGAWGAFTVRRGEEGKGFWTDAYYPYDDAEAQKKVKDVTGAGNSFLGGLMAGLVLHPDDARTAVECAAVSASFIIEQFGLPSVESKAGVDELWNGSSPKERLSNLQSRRN
ncbi:Mak32p [Sporobolomyces salmoneus]|uniref:Mak32p n=1 Tax=Sporobolomyces salmoneus TaxID=183962 RepID=UPI0031784990